MTEQAARKVKRTVKEVAPKKESAMPKRQVSTPSHDLQLIAETLDRMVEMEADYKAVKKKFAEETDWIALKIKEDKEFLLSEAKRLGLKRLESDNHMAEVKPSTSNKIEPKGFAVFLKKIGQTALIWDYLKAQTTQIISSFGEKVLLNEGVLEKEIDEYGNIKVIKKG